MKPHEEAVQEIIKGLEGLEMLRQWELSLTQDVRAKAEALLQSVRGEAPPEDGASGQDV
jgi:hypothetical protein